MPSSHSSSSRGSSRGGSGRSSSSSRSGSGRSPSSHSSSSRGSSYSGSSYRSGPSSRGSSVSSRAGSAFGGVSRYVAGGSMKGQVIQRPRRNQPTGYRPDKSAYRSPTSHMCLKHNYVYYPNDWTDKRSGQSFRKGYYDENGAYYENVIFKQNGRYSKVPCRCDYCGVTTTVTLESDQPLLCNQCGAPLQIQAALDEYTQDPFYTVGNAPLTSGQKLGRFFRKPWVIILLVVLVLAVIGSAVDDRSVSEPGPGQSYEQSYGPALSNVELYGEKLYLDAAGDGAYRFSPDGAASFDKELEWIEEDGGYYDPDAVCWLWYNNEVEEPVWQYWYDGVSSDFGDCGWMEYWPDGWFIEASPGNWIPLPGGYDSSVLWHLEDGLAELS